MTADAQAKPMSGIETLKSMGRGFLFPQGRFAEDRLLTVLLAFSTVVHFAVILLGDFSWVRSKPPIIEEDPIGIDLNDFEAPSKAALPKAQPAPEAKVPQELLPQLPKKFSVKEETKPDEAIAEEKEEVKPEAKPAPEESKAPEAKIKTPTKDDNQMVDAEIRKRAALEALRREDKTAKTMEAPESDPLARLAAELNKSQKKSAAYGSVHGKANVKAYVAHLKKAIRANYNLPEVYNLKGSNIQVTLEITLAERGSLMNLEVVKSSGDSAFDELTVQAVRASVPFDKPPVDMVGSPINLVFTP
ncbi:TonB C terminal [Planctomyces bekefii]|uniref:TonB C terminal n=1 Tax=Planctomyces bekefii TaxID=1653850 RepID=A0A5C6M8Z8_9PLAN|nr:TonB C terminal [Planctomyces bekefii]